MADKCAHLRGEHWHRAGLRHDGPSLKIAVHVPGSLMYAEFRLRCPGAGGHKTGQTGTAQRNVWLRRLAAQTLELSGRLMADTVNREEDRMSSAHQASEQPRPFLQTAVVVKPFPLCHLDERPDAGDLPRPAA